MERVDEAICACDTEMPGDDGEHRNALCDVDVADSLFFAWEAVVAGGGGFRHGGLDRFLS